MYHRVGFTAAQSAELWERWKKGEGLKSIGRAFGKPSSCIFAHLRPSGGIMPPARRRSRLALTMAEREEISRGIVEGQSVRAIARMLARAASTVSRETAAFGMCSRSGIRVGTLLYREQPAGGISVIDELRRKWMRIANFSLGSKSQSELFDRCGSACRALRNLVLALCTRWKRFGFLTQALYLADKAVLSD
jgi:helix-turn-helix protein